MLEMSEYKTNSHDEDSEYISSIYSPTSESTCLV